MTQDLKDLLLKDLSARLPYGVKIRIEYPFLKEEEWHPEILYGLDLQRLCIANTSIRLEEFKAYLFSLSSMTEEQCNEFYCRFVENEIDYNDFKEYYFEGGLWYKLLTSIDDCGEVIDWFNKNHFDYRGLIKKSLAIDATGLNIYKEE